ncbi:twin-arginine translocation signal domain-containing protein [Vibrio mediterranei]|uniref:twin-arginine translocation signal domain-containing protein n=1 Tax=Vibrio mediterranei TaxID=689 RepID=UPI0038CF00CC
MNTKPTMNRREFFKYTAAGAVLGATATYSKPSKAFAFTAAAIATGEKIGWGANPMIQAGKEMLQEQLRKLQTETTSAVINSIGQTAEMKSNALKEIYDNRISRALEPVRDNCIYDEINEQARQAVRNEMEYAEQFRVASKLNPANAVDADMSINFANAIGVATNSYGDSLVTDEEAKNVHRFYTHASLSSVKPSTQTKGLVGEGKLIAPELRLQLVTSFFQLHESQKLSNAFVGVREKVNATYQSDEWRQQINNTAGTASMSEELTHQLATQNELLFHLLILEQRSLVLECIQALNEIKQG